MKQLGVLAGAFNPVTRAHLALADAARDVVDEVVCVLPRAYPHKELHGASLAERLEMLRRASNGYRVEVTEGGLFIDIARELRAAEPETEIYFICGRDAAERVLGWDYGKAGAIDEMLEVFGLLVANREGNLSVPEELRRSIHDLKMAANFDEVSSTEVRRRIEAGEPWQHLVPEPITHMVEEIYSRPYGPSAAKTT